MICIIIFAEYIEKKKKKKEKNLIKINKQYSWSGEGVVYNECVN